MDKDTFEKLMNTYGSDLNRWPKEMAEQLSVAQDQELAKSYIEQQELDKKINSWDVNPPAGYLTQLQAAMDHNIAKASAPILALLHPLGPKALALTCACLLGIVIGFMSEQPDTDSIYFDMIALGYDEQEDL